MRELARLLTAAFDQKGIGVVFDETTGRLHLPAGNAVDLQELEGRYSAGDAGERYALVASWLDAFPPIDLPPDFASVRPHIYPQIRSDWSWPMAHLAMRGAGLPPRQMASMPLAGTLMVTLAVAGPHGWFPVAQDDVARWGVSPHDLFPAAIENLAARQFRVEQHMPGVYLMQTGDGCDAARMLLYDRLQVPVRGELVAIPVQGDCLMLVGSDDEAALMTAAGAVEQMVASDRLLSPRPMLLTRSRWMPFEGKGDVRAVWERIAYSHRAHIAAEQAGLMAAQAARAGDAVHMVPLLLSMHGSSYQTHCTWQDDRLPASLPYAEHIIIRTRGRPAMLADTGAVIACAGHLLIPERGLIPRRYRVEQIPSDEAIAAMHPRLLEVTLN